MICFCGDQNRVELEQKYSGLVEDSGRCSSPHRRTPTAMAAGGSFRRRAQLRGRSMSEFEHHPSRTDVVAYVAAMAAQLAELAGAAQCRKLAHLLKAAAMEARSAAGPDA